MSVVCEHMQVFALVSGVCAHLWAEKCGERGVNKEKEHFGKREMGYCMWNTVCFKGISHIVRVISTSVSFIFISHRKMWKKGTQNRGRREMTTETQSTQYSETNTFQRETALITPLVFYFPSQPPECCRVLIMIVCSYLPPCWPAAVSGWWGSHGVPPQWLKLFSWRVFLPHMQWGWMQEPVDLRYSQRQQRRACRGTYAQKEAQLSCLTSRPCWHWQILTTVRCSWKPLWLTVMNRMIVSERKEKCRLYKSL